MEGSLSNDAVLEQHIPWESYKMNGQISDRDFTLIKKYDKSPETVKASELDESSAAIFEAFFSVLRNVSQESTVQYTLALLDEILSMDPSKEKDMHAPSPQHPGAPPPNRTVILSRLLSRDDWFTQAKAAKLLSIALKSSPADDSPIISQFLEWLTGQLRQPSHGEESVLVASGALAGLLRSREVRAEYARGVSLLVTCMKTAQKDSSAMRSQVLYNLGLCLWQLGFDEAAMKQLLEAPVVEPLVALLKEGNKEKVMRIALMTLTQLVATGEEAQQAAMVDAGLPRIVRIRSAQAWSDEDIPGLLESLDDSLNTSVATLSSFEKYRQEVLTGALDWSPMHTSKAFWQENISAFEEMDFQLLRCLITFLESSEDPTVLAVACNDLGMFADVHPHGRYIVNDLGGKPHVMRHMASQEADVAKHALICVQRLMLGKDKLDFLHDGRRSATNGASTSAAVA
eukprot:jgi/Ulvmu1/6150/UM028_0006.1